ncbi:hypothetical protein J5N97_027327 [Dioscorea zingiberensis]|uniref:Dof zinc finger protein n=1 Tax=Dioscorea zingiberensis TaxID=325984 RepID=A0A9D5C4P9_9LILI|nr:hypothetical protein J5N97_027327 [Dioscorea zingiberensis]
MEMEKQRELLKKKSEEAPKKCPRCESMQTKFCYFNNYSPSQPRHFCKSCKRYWTDGGALRDVPHGGATERRPKRLRKSTSTTSSSSFSPSPSLTPVFPEPFTAPTLLPDFSVIGFEEQQQQQQQQQLCEIMVQPGDSWINGGAGSIGAEEEFDEWARDLSSSPP